MTWIVIATQGEYSDTQTWIVGASGDEATARALLDACKAWLYEADESTAYAAAWDRVPLPPGCPDRVLANACPGDIRGTIYDLEQIDDAAVLLAAFLVRDAE